MTSCDLSENADDAPVFRSKRRWWRLQFGLRTLLVGMAVLAGVGGIGARWIDWSKRQQAMKFLIEEGFDLEFASNTEKASPPGWPAPEAPETWDRVVDVSHAPGPRVTSDALLAMTRLSNLRRLWLHRQYSFPLPSLAGLRALRHLELYGAPISEGDAGRIAECESLVTLTIKVDGKSARELAVLDRLKNLRSLRIDGPLNQAAVGTWRFSSSLEVLHLENAGSLSSEILAELIRRNPSLRSIILPRANCSLELCQALRACKSLKDLRLLDSKIDDEGLAELLGLDQLERLDIQGSLVTGTAFEGAGAFSVLAELDATESQIDDQGAFFLAQLPKLRNLSLRHTQITDVACEYLGRCDVTKLDLGLTKITDRGVEQLNRECLEELKVEETKVTLLFLYGPHPWPKLREVTINKPSPGGGESEELAKIQNLARAQVDAFSARGSEPCKHLRLTLSPPSGVSVDDASEEQ